MLTQKKLDEMQVKAEQVAQERVEKWQYIFLDKRHPENTPNQMTRQVDQAQGPVNNGTIR